MTEGSGLYEMKIKTSRTLNITDWPSHKSVN
jgi:hypothetical protein